MRKDLSNHLTVSENIHKAVKSVCVESRIEMNEMVEQILLTDPRVKKTYNRIEDES